MTSLEIALEYIGRGWSPIPIPHKKKRPLDDEWPGWRITKADAHQRFNGGPQNIGVILGEASAGLADVDLDTIEAVRAGPYFLPRTQCFGRTSKPRSHWLYQSDIYAAEDKAAIQFKFTTGSGKDRKEQMILELRIGGGGKGAQTVFPGSIHESGEPISWDEPSEITRAEGDDLKQRCGRAASAALVAAHFPSKGARHDAGLTLGGFLSRCGFLRPDAELFAEAVTIASGQPREKVRDVRKAAGEAWDEAKRPGGMARGFPALAETFGDDVAKHVAKWLGYQGDHEKASLSCDFIRGEQKQILRGHPDNIRMAIEHLGVSLRQNEFSNMTEIQGLAGYGPELTDAGAIRLRFLIGQTYYFLPPVDLFQDVLTDIAHLNKYHPVRDFLNNLEWDGNPRIDNWLRNYAGAENTPFNRAIGRIFLIAAVRRVRQPGVKFDTMIVFESPIQGKNKSSAMRLLAMREEWFTDNLPLGADPKEVIEQISGIWIVEFAELDGMATRERERITAFLSRQVDKARPAYARRRETVKRQFVACGTTNDTEYLPRDERRMWPVLVVLFDLDKLAKDIEQLWAEAAYYEAQGEGITLQQDLWRAAEEIRAERLFENPYQSTLAEHFSHSTFVTSKEVWNRLAVPEERRKKASREVGQAMHRLGFNRKQCRSDDVPKGCKKGDRYYTKE